MELQYSKFDAIQKLFLSSYKVGTIGPPIYLCCSSPEVKSSIVITNELVFMDENNCMCFGETLNTAFTSDQKRDYSDPRLDNP